MVAQFLAALLYLGVVHGELAHDPLVRSELWKLLQDANYGFSASEQAMFIVRGADGRLSFLRWTSSHVAHQAQWNAPMPLGVIAIAHTHPNHLPRPSTVDIHTALQHHLPVYVVTRTRITRTSEGSVDVVTRGEWWAGG